MVSPATIHLLKLGYLPTKLEFEIQLAEHNLIYSRFFNNNNESLEVFSIV